MRIRVSVPDEHVGADVVDPVLEAVTRLDEHMIRTGQTPTSHELIRQGAIWRPENMGDEHFDHGGTIAQRGWGDCDDWAPLHAATLRTTGEDPGAFARVVPSGPSTFHAIVQRSDGRIDDPSRAAGMQGRANVSGAGDLIDVYACDPHDGRLYQGQLAPTVGPLSMHCGPQVSVRGCTVMGQGPLWQARVDLPIQGSRMVHVRSFMRRKPYAAKRRVHGHLPYALSLTHLAGTRNEALQGALCGAVLAADACEMTACLDRYKLLCVQSAATGMPRQAIHHHLVNMLFHDLHQEAQAQGCSPEQLAHALMAELAGSGIARVPSGHLPQDVQEIASGILSACFPLHKGGNGGRPIVGDFFSDVASTVSNIAKPIADVYNSIPTPVKAILAPQTVVTEYAYQHPESIPMFGSLAAQAKNVFQNVTQGGGTVAQAAQAAASAIHPANIHPAAPQAPAAHVLAVRPPPPPPPPAVQKKVIPMLHIAPAPAAKPPGAAHAAMPVSPAVAPHPTAAAAPALVMPPKTAPAAMPPPMAPHLPGTPPGATHWHCAPLPGGQWACSWQ